jgi:hypothetical protein
MSLLCEICWVAKFSGVKKKRFGGMENWLRNNCKRRKEKCNGIGRLSLGDWQNMPLCTPPISVPDLIVICRVFLKTELVNERHSKELYAKNSSDEWEIMEHCCYGHLCVSTWILRGFKTAFFGWGVFCDCTGDIYSVGPIAPRNIDSQNESGT